MKALLIIASFAIVCINSQVTQLPIPIQGAWNFTSMSGPDCISCHVTNLNFANSGPSNITLDISAADACFPSAQYNLSNYTASAPMSPNTVSNFTLYPEGTESNFSLVNTNNNYNLSFAFDGANCTMYFSPTQPYVTQLPSALVGNWYYASMTGSECDDSCYISSMNFSNTGNSSVTLSTSSLNGCDPDNQAVLNGYTANATMASNSVSNFSLEFDDTYPMYSLSNQNGNNTLTVYSGENDCITVFTQDANPNPSPKGSIINAIVALGLLLNIFIVVA